MPNMSWLQALQVAMMQDFSSLQPPEFVTKTVADAFSNDKIGIVTTIGLQCDNMLSVGRIVNFWRQIDVAHASK